MPRQQELSDEDAVSFLLQPDELSDEDAVAFLTAPEQGGLPDPRQEPPQDFATPLPLASFTGRALEGLSTFAGLGRIGAEKVSGALGLPPETPFFSSLESGLKGLAQEAYPEAQRGTGGFWSEDAPGMFGGIAGIAPAVAAGAPAAILAFGAQTGVPLYYEIKEKTGDEEAATWGLLGGFAIGQLERFGAEKYLGGIISKLSKGKLGKAVKDAVLGWAIAGPTEAVTGASMQGLSDLLQEELTGEELDKLRRMQEVIPLELLGGTGLGLIHRASNLLHSKSKNEVRPTPAQPAQKGKTVAEVRGIPPQTAPESLGAQQAQVAPEAVPSPIAPPGAAQAVQEPATLQQQSLLADAGPEQAQTAQAQGPVPAVQPTAPEVEVAAAEPTQPTALTMTPEAEEGAAPAAAEATAPEPEPLRAKLEQDMAAPEIGTPEEQAEPKQVTELFAGPPLKLGGLPVGKIKAKLTDWITRAGPTHAPKSAKRSLEVSKGFSEAEMSEVSDRAKALDKAVSKLHGKAWQGKPIAQELDAAFEDPAKLAALPDELKRPLSLMRGHLDQMIREQVRTGAVDPQSELAQIVLGSTGKYSKREYRAFNDLKWAEKVDPATKQRFADMLIKEGKTPDEATGITEAILQEAKEAAGNPWQFLQSSKLGNKNLSIYKRRKQVPEELRALLGEIKDPIANYANSVTRIAGVIARHKAYTEIKDSGMKEGWLSEPKKRGKGHSATISSEGNPSLAPLDGMHTTPEIKEALTAVDSATMASYLRPVMAVNSAIKWGKVLGQPTAFMRNLASNVTISLANGHMPLWFKGEAWKHAFQRGGLAERKRLIRLGVLGEGVNTVEWNDYREALKQTPEELAKAQHGLLSMAKTGTEKLYSAADNLPKIMGFYAEEAALLDAGLSPQEAETLASDRIRDLYPTPARMAQALKTLRKSQFIFGQYFSFKAELIRTFMHRLKLIKSELASDNPKIRKMGAKRIMGSVIAHSATPAAALTWRLLQGQDKEDDDDLREFVPEWDKDHELISVGDRLSGQYVDLSDVDPTTMFTDPLMRIAAGDDPDETFIKWMKDNGEAFWGLSPIASLFIEAYTKETKEGRPIDDMPEHVWKEVRPGFLSWWSRASKDFGPDDVASFAIARTYDYDVEKALGKEVSNYYRLISESSQRASRRIGRGKEERGTRKEQEAERRKAFDDLSRKVRAAMRLGLSSYKVEEMLDAQLSGEQTDAVLSGSYLPYEPPE